MGGILSTDNCVDLTPHPFFEEMVGESYTVIRSSGAEDAGWRFSPNTDIDDCTCKEYGGYATKYINVTWRFMMNNGIFCLVDCPAKGDHICRPHSHGWREIRSFWPTRLKTSEEREAWWLLLEQNMAAIEPVQNSVAHETTDPNPSLD
jgi:hypothetical protein